MAATSSSVVTATYPARNDSEVRARLSATELRPASRLLSALTSIPSQYDYWSTNPGRLARTSRYPRSLPLHGRLKVCSTRRKQHQARKVLMVHTPGRTLGQEMVHILLKQLLGCYPGLL